MERLLAIGDIRDLKGVRICTVGPSTAGAAGALRHPRRPDAGGVPRRRRRRAVQGRGPLTGARVLLPRADIARELLADELRDAGAEVTEVIAYRTVLGGGERDGEPTSTGCCSIARSTRSRSRAPRPCGTSRRILGQDQAADLLRTTVVACIGPVTAEAAQQDSDIATTVMPARYTIPDLVDALVEHFAKNEA